jgi:DNA-binding transcriptional MerR regulator
MWATGDIQRMFGVSPQTVRNWTKEFREYLSAGATPTEPGYTRKFTADDLRVFALVVERTHLGATYTDVQAALSEGKRGEIPATADQEKDPIALLSPQEIARTMTIIKERDEARGRIEQLMIERDRDRQTVEQKDKEINELNREIGKLEAKLELNEEKKAEGK